MATYKHGVYTSEQATSMTAPVTGTAGLQVVVGTAPVNMLEHPEQAVNTPLLAYNYKEAVAAVGYHDDFAAYTLCESISAAFSVVGTGPLVLINVLDPAKHTADIDQPCERCQGACTERCWLGGRKSRECDLHRSEQRRGAGSRRRSGQGWRRGKGRGERWL